MLNVAIVEDEYESSDKLTKYLEKYAKENDLLLNVVCFKNGVDFISDYNNNFDLVFMDVDMPEMNGFDAAKIIRERDQTVVIVFVTFLAKYAIRGYEVFALDYLLKPINYDSLKVVLNKAIQICNFNVRRDVVLVLRSGCIRVALSQLYYVEISGHNIVYHTQYGKYEAYGTMKYVESFLPVDQFARCNNCYLVNLRCVSRIDGNYVIIGEERLVISRPRKKAFIEALHKFM